MVVPDLENRVSGLLRHSRQETKREDNLMHLGDEAVRLLLVVVTATVSLVATRLGGLLFSAPRPCAYRRSEECSRDTRQVLGWL